MRISDWSSDVCSSDLVEEAACIAEQADPDILAIEDHTIVALNFFMKRFVDSMDEAPLSHWRTYPQKHGRQGRSEEHTSELQSLMRISYAVLCLTTKNQDTRSIQTHDLSRRKGPPPNLIAQ